MRYSPERKEAILKKLLPPNNKSVANLAAEEGISAATLFNWRKAARRQGRLLPDSGRPTDRWSTKEKFAAVLETASLNEAELASYCRKGGLFPDQIRSWRQACEKANDRPCERDAELREAVRAERKRNKELEREVLRKDKALAEAAALILLRKKAQAIWGDADE
jgi:transposase-like protein